MNDGYGSLQQTLVFAVMASLLALPYCALGSSTGGLLHPHRHLLQEESAVITMEQPSPSMEDSSTSMEESSSNDGQNTTTSLAPLCTSPTPCPTDGMDYLYCPAENTGSSFNGCKLASNGLWSDEACNPDASPACLVMGSLIIQLNVAPVYTPTCSIPVPCPSDGSYYYFCPTSGRCKAVHDGPCEGECSAQAESPCIFLGYPVVKKSLIIFGDSLSDQGNRFILSNGTVPNPHTYWNGRYTNAPGVWVDYLTLSTGDQLDISNFAFAGSNACPNKDFDAVPRNPPHLSQQVAMYLDMLANDTAFAKKVSGPRIAAIWIGSDDFVNLPVGTLPDAALITSLLTCMADAVRSLFVNDHMLTNVVVGTFAPLDLAPASVNSVGPLPAELIHFGLAQLNGAMAQLVHAGNTQELNGTGKSIILWEANTDITLAIEGASLYFTAPSNATCVVYDLATQTVGLDDPTSICQDPQSYVWYDLVHPSSKAHISVANSFKKALMDASLIK